MTFQLIMLDVQLLKCLNFKIITIQLFVLHEYMFFLTFYRFDIIYAFYFYNSLINTNNQDQIRIA